MDFHLSPATVVMYLSDLSDQFKESLQFADSAVLL